MIIIRNNYNYPNLFQIPVKTWNVVLINHVYWKEESQNVFVHLNVRKADWNLEDQYVDRMVEVIEIFADWKKELAEKRFLLLQLLTMVFVRVSWIFYWLTSSNQSTDLVSYIPEAYLIESKINVNVSISRTAIFFC